jgi:hypothetical protein
MRSIGSNLELLDYLNMLHNNKTHNYHYQERLKELNQNNKLVF